MTLRFAISSNLIEVTPVSVGHQIIDVRHQMPEKSIDRENIDQE